MDVVQLKDEKKVSQSGLSPDIAVEASGKTDNENPNIVDKTDQGNVAELGSGVMLQTVAEGEKDDKGVSSEAITSTKKSTKKPTSLTSRFFGRFASKKPKPEQKNLEEEIEQDSVDRTISDKPGIASNDAESAEKDKKVNKISARLLRFTDKKERSSDEQSRLRQKERLEQKKLAQKRLEQEKVGALSQSLLDDDQNKTIPSGLDFDVKTDDKDPVIAATRITVSNKQVVTSSMAENAQDDQKVDSEILEEEHTLSLSKTDQVNVAEPELKVVRQTAAEGEKDSKEVSLEATVSFETSVDDHVDNQASEVPLNQAAALSSTVAQTAGNSLHGVDLFSRGNFAAGGRAPAIMTQEQLEQALVEFEAATQAEAKLKGNHKNTQYDVTSGLVDKASESENEESESEEYKTINQVTASLNMAGNAEDDEKDLESPKELACETHNPVEQEVVTSSMAENAQDDRKSGLEATKESGALSQESDNQVGITTAGAALELLDSAAKTYDKDPNNMENPAIDAIQITPSNQQEVASSVARDAQDDQKVRSEIPEEEHTLSLSKTDQVNVAESELKVVQQTVVEGEKDSKEVSLEATVSFETSVDDHVDNQASEVPLNQATALESSTVAQTASASSKVIDAQEDINPLVDLDNQLIALAEKWQSQAEEEERKKEERKKEKKLKKERQEEAKRSQQEANCKTATSMLLGQVYNHNSDSSAGLSLGGFESFFAVSQAKAGSGSYLEGLFKSKNMKEVQEFLASPEVQAQVTAESSVSENAQANPQSVQASGIASNMVEDTQSDGSESDKETDALQSLVGDTKSRATVSGLDSVAETDNMENPAIAVAQAMASNQQEIVSDTSVVYQDSMAQVGLELEANPQSVQASGIASNVVGDAKNDGLENDKETDALQSLVGDTKSRATVSGLDSVAETDNMENPAIAVAQTTVSNQQVVASDASEVYQGSMTQVGLGLEANPKSGQASGIASNVVGDAKNDGSESDKETDALQSLVGDTKSRATVSGLDSVAETDNMENPAIAVAQAMASNQQVFASSVARDEQADQRSSLEVTKKLDALSSQSFEISDQNTVTVEDTWVMIDTWVIPWSGEAGIASNMAADSQNGDSEIPKEEGELKITTSGQSEATLSTVVGVQDGKMNGSSASETVWTDDPALALLRDAPNLEESTEEHSGSHKHQGRDDVVSSVADLRTGMITLNDAEQLKDASLLHKDCTNGAFNALNIDGFFSNRYSTLDHASLRSEADDSQLQTQKPNDNQEIKRHEGLGAEGSKDQVQMQMAGNQEIIDVADDKEEKDRKHSAGQQLLQLATVTRQVVKEIERPGTTKRRMKGAATILERVEKEVNSLKHGMHGESSSKGLEEFSASSPRGQDLSGRDQGGIDETHDAHDAKKVKINIKKEVDSLQDAMHGESSSKGLEKLSASSPRGQDLSGRDQGGIDETHDAHDAKKVKINIKNKICISVIIAIFSLAISGGFAYIVKLCICNTKGNTKIGILFNIIWGICILASVFALVAGGVVIGRIYKACNKQIADGQGSSVVAMRTDNSEVTAESSKRKEPKKKARYVNDKDTNQYQYSIVKNESNAASASADALIDAPSDVLGLGPQKNGKCRKKIGRHGSSAASEECGEARSSAGVVGSGGSKDDDCSSYLSKLEANNPTRFRAIQREYKSHFGN